ncbi:MAG: T9SS type A sorting domain-containing protein [Bacteroidetes bacterium]|nr:T9SS type A sorting domain-containing protein [Bacteroidota bacterium]
MKKFRIVKPSRLLVLLAVVFFESRCNAQNLFTKMYDSSGEYSTFSISEQRDSSLVFYGINWVPSKTVFFHLDSLGDSISKFVASPPIYAVWNHITFNDSLILAAVQSQNGVHGIQSAVINPKTWQISDTVPYALLGFAYPVCVYRARNGDVLIGSTGPSAGLYGLIRTDSLFNIKWTQFCQGGAYKILEDSLGNILTSGNAPSQTLQPFILNYFDSAGNLIWNQWYGNNISFSGNIGAGYIFLLPDSNFALIGEGGGYPEYNYVKIDRATGDTLKTKTTSYFNPRPVIRISPDILFGCSYDDFLFYDNNGDLLYSKPIPIPNKRFLPSSSVLTQDGGIAIAGVTVPGSNNNVRLPTVIKIDTLGNSVPLSAEDMAIFKEKTLTVYPNPVSDILNLQVPIDMQGTDVTVTVYDALGSLKLEVKSLKINTDATQIDCSSLSNGIYIISIQSEERRYWQKFVVGH